MTEPSSLLSEPDISKAIARYEAARREERKMVVLLLRGEAFDEARRQETLASRQALLDALNRLLLAAEGAAGAEEELSRLHLAINYYTV